MNEIIKTRQPKGMIWQEGVRAGDYVLFGKLMPDGSILKLKVIDPFNNILLIPKQYTASGQKDEEVSISEAARIILCGYFGHEGTSYRGHAFFCRDMPDWISRVSLADRRKLRTGQSAAKA